MSPEQLRSTKNVDARTDIWALGVVLYELLTGRLPFGGSTLSEQMMAIVEQPIRSVRTLRLDVPVGLDETIMACLIRDPTLRLASVGTLAAALRPFGRHAPASPAGPRLLQDLAVSRSPASSTRSADAPFATTLPSNERTHSPAVLPGPRVVFRRAIAALVALGMVAVAAVVVIVHRHPASAMASPPNVAIGTDVPISPIPGPRAPAIEAAPEIAPMAPVLSSTAAFPQALVPAPALRRPHGTPSDPAPTHAAPRATAGPVTAPSGVEYSPTRDSRM